MKTTNTSTGIKFTRWMRNSVPPPSYVKAAGFQVFWNNVIAVTLPNKAGELAKFVATLASGMLMPCNAIQSSSRSHRGQSQYAVV
jgi:hypothetical protein